MSAILIVINDVVRDRANLYLHFENFAARNLRKDDWEHLEVCYLDCDMCLSQLNIYLALHAPVSHRG